MPKRPTSVELHPQREKIIKALIRGDSYRTISGQYGIPQSTLAKFVGTRLKPEMAEAVAMKKLETGQDVLAALNEVLEGARKLYAAGLRDLADPDRPGELTMDPRADEVEVLVEYEDHKDDKGMPVYKRRREALDILLGELEEKGYRPLEYKVTRADPRMVFLKNNEVITRQLEAASKLLQGVGSAEGFSITVSMAWMIVQSVIVKVTRRYPDVYAELVKTLQRQAGEEIK